MYGLSNDIDDYINEKRFLLDIGFDFGHGTTQGTVGLRFDGALYIFKEYTNVVDTPEIAEMIKSDFPNCKILAYPDAAGASRKSVNASISDITILKKAGFTVRARSKNPFVKDRVASVNNAFNKGKLFIDTDRCPELTAALEQQIWLPNGSPDKSSGLDHIVDALGYMVHYLMPVREIKPKHFGVVQ